MNAIKTLPKSFKRAVLVTFSHSASLSWALIVSAGDQIPAKEVQMVASYMSRTLLSDPHSKRVTEQHSNLINWRRKGETFGWIYKKCCQLYCKLVVDCTKMSESRLFSLCQEKHEKTTHNFHINVISKGLWWMDSPLTLTRWWMRTEVFEVQSELACTLFDDIHKPSKNFFIQNVKVPLTLRFTKIVPDVEIQHPPMHTPK